MDFSPDAPNGIAMEGYLYKRASNAFKTWSRYTLFHFLNHRIILVTLKLINTINNNIKSSASRRLFYEVTSLKDIFNEIMPEKVLDFFLSYYNII